MTEVVQFDEDVEVLIRPAETDYGLEPVGTLEDAVRRVQGSLADAMASIRGVADAVQEQVARMAARPDEVSAQFGLELSTAGRFVVVSADVKATVTVQLTWRPGGQPPSGQPA